MMIPEHIKYLFSGLLTVAISMYSLSAVAKSAAGIGVPRNSMATPDAPASFFRRSSGTPIFRAVVFMCTPWFYRDNGSPGGAAFGLAGIH